MIYFFHTQYFFPHNQYFSVVRTYSSEITRIYVCIRIHTIVSTKKHLLTIHKHYEEKMCTYSSACRRSMHGWWVLRYNLYLLDIDRSSMVLVSHTGWSDKIAHILISIEMKNEFKKLFNILYVRVKIFKAKLTVRKS